jgi:HAE1 family hydrophobic/amphiphilic exporter-1
MKLTDISIAKPIATIFIVILFLLLGGMGGINLGADLFPSVNIPVIVISSTYPGASAEEIEKDVIKPLEDAVSVISGVDKVNAMAMEGYAQIVLQFKMTVDTSDAFLDTQKEIEGVVGKLPKEATRPSIKKIDPGAAPILQLTLSGNSSLEELNGKADLLKERIERIEGVGKVTIFGGLKKQLQINVDKSKIDYYGLSLSQIISKIQSDNINFPGGIINQPQQDKIINIKGEFENINQVKDLRMPVKTGFVRLGDISEVTLSYPKPKEISRLNEKSAIGLSIQKQGDANIVETGNKVKEEIEKLKSSFKGIELTIIDDGTLFINSSLKETRTNLIEGIFTTAIILFIFLRQWNSVIIAIVAIPTSLVSTFFMMYMSNFTFNILSLMGLALCVGILVDDSVVVLENIHRHLGMGKNPKQAARDGRSEIGMAAIAITLSDIVVFAPIAFMSGVVGQYFKQFGLVVVFATLFSLLVSFTLTPMMASRMFKIKHKTKGRFKGITTLLDRMDEKIREIYLFTLKKSLNHRFFVIIITILLLASSVSLIITGKLGTEFMPYMDEGKLNVSLTLAPGSTLQNTDEKVKIIEEYLNTLKGKEIDYYSSKIGAGNGESNQANKGSIFVKLVNKSKRQKSQKEMVEVIRTWTKENISGANVVVLEPSMDGGTGGNSAKPININVKGSNMEIISELAKKVEEIVKSTNGVIDVDNSSEQGKPAYKVQIDKVIASKYGISSFELSNTIRSSIEGSKAGKFRQDNEDYDAIVKLKDNSIKDINDLKTLYVSNNMGTNIQVGQISNLSLSDSPVLVSRLNKQRVSTISSNIKQGYTLGQVSEDINNKLSQISLADGYSISVSGEQEQMDETFTSLIQVLILSVLLVYMILGILYESFLTPFVRILALPVGFIGALYILVLTGNTLNMMSMIGLIMLDGLAAKNGTLMIDYTNTLMSQGLSLRDALIEAGKIRIRPILMTSLSMIVGMMPTALAFGDGSEFKSSMALVIIGGLISSTILSPIVIPVAYTLIDDLQNYLKKIFFGGKYESQKNSI